MYQVWKVIENTDSGQLQRYYVVNSETSRVQSTWKDLKSAADTCDRLNKYAKRMKA